MPMRKIAISFATGATALALTVAPLTVFAAGPATQPATPPSTQAAQPMHPGHEQWSHRTAVVQEALNSTGANLRIDGVLGPSTEQALKNYQRNHNLPVTGQLDHATMMRLDPIG
jgi:peptidoglycan hydrolase-like protein with peptidoglycan-binding domain